MKKNTLFVAFLSRMVTILAAAALVCAAALALVCSNALAGVPVLGSSFAAHQAFADSGDPAMATGAAPLAKNVGTTSAQKVWYGRDAEGNTRDWYVIGYEAADSPGAKVTLLHQGVGEHTKFNSTGALGNAYGTSDLKTHIETWLAGGSRAKFSADEQRFILSRTLEGGGSNYDSAGYDTAKMKGDSVTNALLWPLSVFEAESVPESLRGVDAGIYWWLRSPGRYDSGVAAVLPSGKMQYDGFQVANVPIGVRPAFYLDKSAILFTSAAEGGKESGPMGSNALSAVGTNNNRDWKVTLKDSSRSSFTATPTSDQFEDTVQVAYANAKTGENEYLSAIITNQAGDITYYGRIAQCSTESGTVEINLASKMDEGDKLYVFNEQYNGNEQTDFASDLQIISPTYFYLGSTAVNDGNKDNILGAIDPGTGLPTASYDPDTNTLTVHNPAIADYYKEGSNEGYIYVPSENGLTIRGQMAIIGDAVPEAISGPGPFIFEEDETAPTDITLSVNNSRGTLLIYSRKGVIMNGGTLRLKTTNGSGIWSPYGSLVVNDGNIYFDCSDKTSYLGSYSLAEGYAKITSPDGGSFGYVSGNLYGIVDTNGNSSGVAAIESGYDLWVGATRVTKSNQDNILRSIDGETGLPSLSYNPDTKTLTSRKAMINGFDSSVGFFDLGEKVEKKNRVARSDQSVGIYSEDSLTIEGWVRVDGYHYGIYIAPPSEGETRALTMASDSDVDIDSIDVADSYGIVAQNADVQIMGGEHRIWAWQHPIYTTGNGKLLVEGGIVEAYAEADGNKAIYAQGGIEISGDLGIINPVMGKLSEDGQYLVDNEGNAADYAKISPLLFIGDTPVTFANCEDIPGVAGDGAKASYDFATNTLSLENITGLTECVNKRASVIHALGDLNIRGTCNIVTTVDALPGVPSYSIPQSLVVEGKLTVLDGDLTFKSDSGLGSTVQVGDTLEIQGGNLSVEGSIREQVSLRVNGSIVIGENAGTLTVQHTNGDAALMWAGDLIYDNHRIAEPKDGRIGAGIDGSYHYVVGDKNRIAPKVVFDRSKTLTLHWSSLDGTDIEGQDPIVIAGITPGTSIEDALAKENRTLYQEVFTKDGYIDVDIRLFEPMNTFDNWDAADSASVYGDEQITEDTHIYYVMGKTVDSISVTVQPPLCGTKTEMEKDEYGDWDPLTQTNRPVASVPAQANYGPAKIGRLAMPLAFWGYVDPTTEEILVPYNGTFKADEAYDVMLFMMANYGYTFIPESAVQISGATVQETFVENQGIPAAFVNAKIKAVHNWDSGKVTKEPTTTSTGIKTYTCKGCGKTKTEVIPKKVAPVTTKTTIKSATAPAQKYTGKALKPAVTVKDANGKTVPASAYTVTYANNTYPGTATATVKAKANSKYTGTVKATFKITAAEQGVYWLVNKKTGENLYTTAVKEVNTLSKVKKTWTNKGIMWYAPTVGEPIYRLHNPKTGDHHFTKSANEVRVLTKVRKTWKADFDGKPIFYSGGPKKIWRQYSESRWKANKPGTHKFTTYNAKLSGWKNEGALIDALRYGKVNGVK